MLQIKNLTKKNGLRVVLNNINIDIQDNEFFCFLGPSGSGKTALLRIIAGLEAPTSGEIILNRENILKQPAFKRNVNTVFNSFALFPHLSLYKNIEYGLNFKNIGSKEKERIVRETIEFFNLEKYEKSNVNSLEPLIKYKVTLGRALICNPQILLLDDSLKLLPRQDRMKMRYELKQLHQRLGNIMIYITDDIDNAFALSDRISILYRGSILQTDAASVIYESPKTYFVANYVSDTNLFNAKVKSIEEGHYIIELDNKFSIRFLTTEEFKVGDDLFFSLRPSRINISYENNTDLYINSLRGKLVQKDYRGEFLEYFIELDGGRIIMVAEPNYKFLEAGKNTQISSFFEIGEEVYVSWNIMSGNLVWK